MNAPAKFCFSELEALIPPPGHNTLWCVLLNIARIGCICEATCQALHLLWQRSRLRPQLQSKLLLRPTRSSNTCHCQAYKSYLWLKVMLTSGENSLQALRTGWGVPGWTGSC